MTQADDHSFMQRAGKPAKAAKAMKTAKPQPKPDKPVQHGPGDRSSSSAGPRERVKGGMQLSEAALDRARRQGNRFASLLQAAPPTYQPHLRRHLVGGLFKRLRSRLREALMLGTMLCQTGSPTSTVMPDEARQDDFIEAICQGNLGLADDVCVAAGALPDRPYSWPSRQRDLLTQVPELRQLCVWGMTLGTDSDDDAPDSMPSTPPTPPSTATFRPEDLEPTIDIEEGADSTLPPLDVNAAPGPSTLSATRRPPELPERDEQSLIQLFLDQGNDGQGDDDDEVTSLVQTIMEHSDVEATSDVAEEGPDNLVWPRWSRHLRAEVMRTLDTLWERGDEMVVEALSHRILQAGSQMQQPSHTYQDVWYLANAVRPFCRHSQPPGFLAPAWNDWVEDILDAAWREARRERGRFADSCLLMDNQNSPGTLALRNSNNFAAVALVEDPTGDAMSLVTTTKGSRRWGKPAHPEFGPDASFSEKWVAPRRTDPGVERDLPWRRKSSPGKSVSGKPSTSRPSSGVIKKPKAKSRPSTRHGRDRAEPHRGRPAHGPRVCSPGDSRAGPHEEQDRGGEGEATGVMGNAGTGEADSSEPELAEAPDLALQLALDAADVWRPLLGIGRPRPPRDDQGGVLPQLRAVLGERILAMTAVERARLLAQLNIFVSSLVQEVAMFIESVTSDEAPTDHDVEVRPDIGAEDVADGQALVENEEEELPGPSAFEEDSEDYDEEDRPDDPDHSSMMQMERAGGNDCNPLTAAFVVQSALNALHELREEDASSVAQALHEELSSYDQDLMTVSLMTQALRSRLPDLGPRALPLTARLRPFFDKWWTILRRHLPAPPLGADAQAEQPAQPRRPSPLEPQTAAVAVTTTARNVSTQTASTLDERTDRLELLVTASTSTQQLASKFQTLTIPHGESVAISLLAAVQPPAASSCDPCSLPGSSSTATLVPCVRPAARPPGPVACAERPLPLGVARGEPLPATVHGAVCGPHLMQGVSSTLMNLSDEHASMQDGTTCSVLVDDVDTVPAQLPPVQVDERNVRARRG